MRKKIPSAVVYYYYDWYLFSRIRRYLTGYTKNMANPSRIPVRIPIGKADDRMLKVVTLAETEPVKGQLNSE